jgi:hypothetical protein
MIIVKLGIVEAEALRITTGEVTAGGVNVVADNGNGLDKLTTGKDANPSSLKFNATTPAGTSDATVRSAAAGVVVAIWPAKSSFRKREN